MSFIHAKLIFISIFYFCALTSCTSGPCDYPDDRARDGSRCGDRAASVKPGGRNPDLNKIFYGVLVIGGGFLVLNLISNSNQKSKSNNSNYTPYIQTSHTPKQREVKHKTLASKPAQKENMLAAIERVLWKEFNYKIDQMFIETYQEIVASTEKQHYTPSDGAILYMLAIISFMKPSIADNEAKSFVRKHIATCQRLLPSGNLPKVETFEHLEKVKGHFS